MPTGNVCMTSNNFTLFIVICIGIVFFCLYRAYHLQELLTINNAEDNQEIDNKSQSCPVCPQISCPIPNPMPSIPPDSVFRIERDPWIQPVRPNPWTPVVLPKIYTQGPVGDFAQVGFITKKNAKKPEKKMMPLYGRRTYGIQFEYYVINPRNGIKIPVFGDNGNKELYNDDIIYIPELNDKYIITMYNYWG